MRRRSPRRFSRRMHFPAPDVGLGETSGRSHFVGLLPPPPPLCFVRLSLSCLAPCGTEDAFVGLNQGDCFHHQTIHARPSPVVKHQPRGETAAPLCGAPYHPDFTSAFQSPFFVPSQKKAFARGRGGVFLLPPLTRGLKGRSMGESSPRKPG